MYIFDARKNQSRALSEHIQGIIANHQERSKKGLHQDLFAGQNPKRYGPHTIKKAGATYASTCSSAPPVMAVQHQMDQSPKTKQEKPYFTETARGDALAGRTMTGLLPTDPYYCQLPPHFPPSYGELINILPQIIDSYGKDLVISLLIMCQQYLTLYLS